MWLFAVMDLEDVDQVHPRKQLHDLRAQAAQGQPATRRLRLAVEHRQSAYRPAVQQLHPLQVQHDPISARLVHQTVQQPKDFMAALLAHQVRRHDPDDGNTADIFPLEPV
jgi:hypothetical protein